MGLLEPLIQGFPQVTVILWNNPATRYKPSTSDFRFCGNAFFVFRGDIWRGAIGGPPIAQGFATPIPVFAGVEAMFAGDGRMFAGW